MIPREFCGQRLRDDEEEKEVFAEYRGKDNEKAARAAERIFMNKTGMVLSIAKRYRWTEIDILTLFAQGCVGLAEAMKSFDLKRGTQFSTPAFWEIRKAIQNLVNNREERQDRELSISSLEEPVPWTNGKILADYVPDYNSLNPEREVERIEFWETVFSCLDQESAFVIYCYYGLGKVDDEIAELLPRNLTLSRAGQIRRRAIETLKNSDQITEQLWD